MSASGIFTRRRMGLDRNVWLMMIVVCVLCMGLLSYKIITEEPCSEIRLAVKSDLGAFREFHTKDALVFTASTEAGKEITWDFADNSRASYGASVSHIFDSAGEYRISATSNGKCSEYLMVKIIPGKQELEDISPVYVGTVIRPSNPYPRVGEIVGFSSNIDAKLYEWSIEGSAQPSKKDKMATFIFDQAKSYTVVLKLDNDPKKTYTVPISVAPAASATQPKPLPTVPRILVPDNYPPPYTPPVANNPVPANDPKPAEVKPAPEVKKADPVPDGPVQPPRVYYYKNTDQFKGMLEEVITGDKNVKDFDKYLCDGANTAVTENGVQITFIQLCRNIANSKIEDIQVTFLDVTTFADKSRCVKELKVTYKKPKSGWLHKN